MTGTAFWRLFIFTILAAVLWSCSKDDDNPYAHPSAKSGEQEQEEESVLPSLYVYTANSAAIQSKKDWVVCPTVKLKMPDEEIIHLGSATIKGRGNSTWGYAKKPYALKLDEKQTVLGMPKEKRFDLLANYIDRTDMRNAIGFEIARKTESLEWTPRGEFVELYLNGVWQGNYYLCEHIKIGSSRIDIDNGYILELDTNYDEDFKFRSDSLNLPVQLKDPDPDEFTAEQLADIKTHFNDVERLVTSGADMSEIEKYIDVDTFVDWWIAVELTQCGEPKHPKSCYMYRDLDDGSGGRYKMGPVWDFDWGTFRSGSEVTAFRIMDAIWYKYLFRYPEFVNRVKTKWSESKSDFLTVTDFIDKTAADVEMSVEKDKVKWPMTTTVNKDESLTFDGAVQRIKNNYMQHIDWMDSHIGVL